MNEQPTNSANEVLENIARQNQKMRKKLITVILIVLGVIVLLIGTLLIIKAVNKKDGEFTLPDDYFYPTHNGDIFEYQDYLEMRPDVIFYCEDPDGRGRTTDNVEDFPIEALYLRDFLEIMMHADVEAYNDCFNEIYYKNNQRKTAFSQQMIYEAEIRFANDEKASTGERTVTYYLCYKLFENDGSLRRDVGSDAMVPMKVVLRVTADGEISISEWSTTRVQK